MSPTTEKRLDEEVKARFEASVPKYYHHTLKVVANMRRLLENSPLSERELVAAAYLHDIGYSLPYQGGFVGEIEDQSVKITLHSEEGSKLAAEILSSMGWETSLLDRVAYLVSNHHRRDVADDGLQLLLRADEV